MQTDPEIVKAGIRRLHRSLEAPLWVAVYVYRDHAASENGRPRGSYVMDHNDPAQRRVLGEQCRNAFEAGQCIVTFPVNKP